MDDIAQRPIPPDWIDALDRAEADVAAGRTVDAETIHKTLRDGIARMEARLATDPTPARPRHRAR